MCIGKHFCWLALLAACQSRTLDVGKGRPPAPSSSDAFAKERSALLVAEQQRDSAAIGADALSSRDPTLRRTAARALARIADTRAAELLRLALSDEDPEVSTWGAYGLGYACLGRETTTVRALALRAASLPTDEKSSLLANPVTAISDALGRCAGSEAESTLRAWLGGPQARAEAAALALGRIAGHDGKLSDKTLVALLDAADRPQNPLESALFPVTRLATLNASTSERTLRLSLRLIAAHAPGSEFALRALARTGEAGAVALGDLLVHAELTPGLRAEAIHELSTLGDPGRRALWAAFNRLPGRTLSDADWEGTNYGPFRALLDALSPPIVGSDAQLLALSALTLAEQDSRSVRQRKVRARCTAAALLAGSNYRDPRLLACDPVEGSPIRELSVLRVIGRERLRGARKLAYLLYTRATSDPVRAAAIEQLAEHRELGEAHQVLADALAHRSPGVVASAARVLASYPERALRATDPKRDTPNAPNPDQSIILALGSAYGEARAKNRVEIQSLLLDAIGALQILTLKDACNSACQSDNPTLREHAERALHSLGEQSRRCTSFTPEVRSSVRAPSTSHSLLRLETDAGPLTLTLDASWAPNAVARIIALAQAGFYDGIVVHRVVPGFVAQFGDPAGDGYGGDDQPPLRCETSPIPFQTGAVGVALSGRDTGSSQLFVTLGRYPHLDGQYAWLGLAGPGWDRLAEGDRILRVQVSSAP